MNKREEEIKKIAYEIYQKNGCQSGHELDNWLEAEKKVGSICWPWRKLKNNKPCSYDLLVSVIGGIIASLIVSFGAWWFINYINPNKVFLCLRYAYEYNYEAATQEDPIRIIDKNKPIQMISGQNLWFALLNTNINSIEGCTLHLDFDDGLVIKPQDQWQIQLPNKNFTCIFRNSINNGLVIGTYPLQIEFKNPEKTRYSVRYSITAKNMSKKDGQFFI